MSSKKLAFVAAGAFLGAVGTFFASALAEDVPDVSPADEAARVEQSMKKFQTQRLARTADVSQNVFDLSAG